MNPKNPSGVSSDAPMTIVTHASGVGGVRLRRAPRPAASSIAANAEFHPASRRNGVGSACRRIPAPLRGLRSSSRASSMATRAKVAAARSAPPNATEPWPASPLPCASRRRKPGSEEEKEERDERDQTRARRSGAGLGRPASRRTSRLARSRSLGSFQSRTRPPKNDSPASTPASGRKRSNRSETTQFLSFGFSEPRSPCALLRSIPVGGHWEVSPLREAAKTMMESPCHSHSRFAQPRLEGRGSVITACPFPELAWRTSRSK